MVINLNAYCGMLKGDFDQKMEKLNELTKELINKH